MVSMDKFIKRFDFRKDDDLHITKRGIAYQGNVKPTVSYDEAYFNTYVGYEGSQIEKRLNEGRRDFVNRHHRKELIDVGIGSGAFIRCRENTKGHDINPYALQWLAENGKHEANFDNGLGFSFWDVIEHVEDPNIYFKKIRKHSYLFTSIPIINVKRIRQSKHYKPGEHLYYFTEDGFINWMAMYGFRHLETSDFETKAGRKDILSFAFKKDLPDHRDMVGQYKELHCLQHYGGSSYIYLDQVTEVVKRLNPKSILDYGCGRSDLIAHFYKDGERKLYRFDPAIPRFKQMPSDRVDLVLCTDVMEHILIGDVDRIFNEIVAKSKKVLFTIFLNKSRAKLPDGRNAHVTLLTRSEWLRWVEDVFGKAKEIPIGEGYGLVPEKMLMVKTW